MWNSDREEDKKIKNIKNFGSRGPPSKTSQGSEHADSIYGFILKNLSRVLTFKEGAPLFIAHPKHMVLEQ